MDSTVLLQNQRTTWMKTAFTLAVLSALLAMVAFGQSLPQRWIFMGIAAVLGGISGYYFSKKTVQGDAFGKTSMMAMLMIAVPVGPYTNGGFYSATMSWLAITPLMYAIAFGGGWRLHVQVVWNVMLVLYLGYRQFYLEDLVSITAPRLRPGYEIMQLLMQSVALGYTFFMHRRYERAHRQWLQDLLQQERHMASMKSNFISNVSHEVRSPLNGIYGTLQALSLDPSLGPKQRSILTASLSTAKHLRAIMSDILDVQKMAENRLVLRPQRVSVAELFTSVVDQFVPIAEANHVALVLSMADDVPEHVWLDHVRYNQIIINLVANAVKYTPSGRIDVTVSYAKNVLRVEVNDTGVGISEQMLPHVFERFARAPEVIAENIEGTGLGMAIVKDLVTLFDGHIELKSQLGIGTAVSVEVPVSSAFEKASNLNVING